MPRAGVVGVSGWRAARASRGSCGGCPERLQIQPREAIAVPSRSGSRSGAPCELRLLPTRRHLGSSAPPPAGVLGWPASTSAPFQPLRLARRPCGFGLGCPICAPLRILVRPSLRPSSQPPSSRVLIFCLAAQPRLPFRLFHSLLFRQRPVPPSIAGIALLPVVAVSAYDPASSSSDFAPTAWGCSDSDRVKSPCLTF